MSVLVGGSRNSKIKAGDNYDQSKLTDERERIETLMKNNGFYTFSRQFVEFNVFVIQILLLWHWKLLLIDLKMPRIISAIS